jgi:hypothetical protein
VEPLPFMMQSILAGAFGNKARNHQAVVSGTLLCGFGLTVLQRRWK